MISPRQNARANDHENLATRTSAAPAAILVCKGAPIPSTPRRCTPAPPANMQFEIFELVEFLSRLKPIRKMQSSSAVQVCDGMKLWVSLGRVELEMHSLCVCYIAGQSIIHDHSDTSFQCYTLVQFISLWRASRDACTVTGGSVPHRLDSQSWKRGARPERVQRGALDQAGAPQIREIWFQFIVPLLFHMTTINTVTNTLFGVRCCKFVEAPCRALSTQLILLLHTFVWTPKP